MLPITEYNMQHVPQCHIDKFNCWALRLSQRI